VILIIEDTPDISQMLKMILEYKGYDVITTENIEKATTLLNDQAIDLIIMDMLLSGVNGVDVCRSYKKIPAIDNIPLIMMSAHPDAEQKCMEAGADDFIFKPFDMEEILSKVKVLLESKVVRNS